MAVNRCRLLFVCLVISAASYIVFVLVTQALLHLKIHYVTSAGMVIDESIPPVIFIESSGKIPLKIRAACSIESAALHHPQRYVILYSIAQLPTDEPYVTVLRNVANIKFKVLIPEDQLQGTPFEPWHGLGLLEKSKWPMNQLSNALRLAVLWKEGGVYLDTDVIVLRAFQGLRNALALQSGKHVNSAILVFDQHHHFLLTCMRDFIKNYNGSIWGQQGPQMVTRILKDYCNSTVLEEMVNRPAACQGVSVLSPEAFYPLQYEDWRRLFKSADKFNISLNSSYAFHLWGFFSRQLVIIPGNNTLLEQLASINCPLVYEIMKKSRYF